MSESRDLRSRYMPDEVRVLFVGESPPAGGTFFYAGNSRLFAATRDAFTRALGRGDNADFLEVFKSLGCYLDDLCLEPVNHLSIDDPARHQARSEGEGALARRIAGVNPRAVVPVMKAIARNVQRSAGESGYSAALVEALPFPGRPQHTKRFVEGLASLVREWVDDGTVLT